MNFEKLKETLTSDLVLALPNFDEQFILSTDASEHGYGAVLEQLIDGQLRPIAFFSRNFTPTQKKYSTSEKELLALVMAVEYFHQFLYGRKFKVKTDHLPLTWLPTKKNVQARLERWFLRLDLYDLEIEYKPGKENVVQDWLSRIPEQDVCDQEDNDYFDNVVASITVNSEVDEHLNSQGEEANVSTIVDNPSSENLNEFQSLSEEQSREEDIKWIKNLILTKNFYFRKCDSTNFLQTV
ncbi:unnamed protein product [Brachionus calyciflorus]|uniref:Reverse transcriptase RNase H-like domain-containing protein n=1 Tax=Brachionus calyciflorus TaxID=104777 RepID=A0A813VGW8_9BILA|nr:unnamed protein product [Brachionus calyciflorus]